jgi:hypothetical protein
MNQKILFPSLLTAFLVMGCQKEVGDTLPIGNEPSEASVLTAQTELAALLKTKKWTSKLDLAIAEQAHPNTKKLGKNVISDKYRQLAQNEDFLFYRELVNRAINPSDYKCSPTIIDAYIPPLIKNWSFLDKILYSFFGDLAFWEAYLYDNTEGGDYYGVEHEFSYPVNSSFKSLKRFWNIPTNIQIADAHGSVYKDTRLITKIIQEVYVEVDAAGKVIPVDYDEAVAVAKSLKTVFGSKNFMQYNHPLFTFNAFADSGVPALGIPKKVVMGDGLLKAYADLGYGDVAPQAIVAHEYGHHIQFANKYFGKVESPEETRRTELMADAYAAYFLAQKQGLAMNAQKIRQFLEVFYAIGDCGFKSLGHHGTPNQRKKAAAFGAKLATDAQTANTKLTSQQFYTLFTAALPTIVLPDAL